MRLNLRLTGNTESVPFDHLHPLTGALHKAGVCKAVVRGTPEAAPFAREGVGELRRSGPGVVW